MNIYTYVFVVNCPLNSESIIYTLVLRHLEKVLVEHIKTACSLFKVGHHEDIADELFRRFGGEQVLTAHHHGVDLRSERGGE